MRYVHSPSVRVLYLLVLPGLLAAACVPAPAPPVTDADFTVTLSLVAAGLTSPTALVASPDDSGRLFVVDQIGLIRVIDSDGNLLDTPFVDLRDRLVSLMPAFDERGLLSMAFHPDYAANGRFFVCYNAPLTSEDADEGNSRLRISEFLISAGDPAQADAGSEIILLEVLKPQFNHNGGQLAFGPDGMLYVGIGDGGAANDIGTGHTPGLGNGQDPTNLLGTILRYSADTPGMLVVPADNPFLAEPDILPAVYAYGFRNPWRFSFDRGGNRALFVADVGQNLFEEVNIVEAGGNYGWNIREGFSCFDPGSPDSPPASCADTGARGRPLRDPILAYAHPDSGEAIAGLAVIGGFVYRGQMLPALAGRYVFADWSRSFLSGQGSLLMATEDAAGAWSLAEAAVAGESDGRIGRFILGLGQDQAGELYVLTSRTGGPSGSTGEVFKITDTQSD